MKFAEWGRYSGGKHHVGWETFELGTEDPDYDAPEPEEREQQGESGDPLDEGIIIDDPSDPGQWRDYYEGLSCSQLAARYRNLQHLLGTAIALSERGALDLDRHIPSGLMAIWQAQYKALKDLCCHHDPVCVECCGMA